MVERVCPSAAPERMDTLYLHLVEAKDHRRHAVVIRQIEVLEARGRGLLPPVSRDGPACLGPQTVLLARVLHDGIAVGPGKPHVGPVTVHDIHFDKRHDCLLTTRCRLPFATRGDVNAVRLVACNLLGASRYVVDIGPRPPKESDTCAISDSG